MRPHDLTPDPVPLGNKAEPSLLPLIGEYLQPPHPPMELEPPSLLPTTAFASARLDAGSKVEGYEGGTKIAAKEAHEKRMRRKQARLSASVAPDPEAVSTPAPRPPPRPAMRGRGTPSSRGFMPRASAPPGYRPGTPQRTPGTPLKRPGDSVGPNAKRRALPGSRSASPAAGGPGSSQPSGPRAVFKRDY